MNGDESQLTDGRGPGDEKSAAVTYEVSEDESITHAVTAAMSSADGTSETDLRPLYSAVDPDALDAIFASQSDDTSRDPEGTVTFEYGSRRVRVESDGTVRVY